MRIYSVARIAQRPMLCATECLCNCATFSKSEKIKQKSFWKSIYDVALAVDLVVVLLSFYAVDLSGSPDVNLAVALVVVLLSIYDVNLQVDLVVAPADSKSRGEELNKLR